MCVWGLAAGAPAACSAAAATGSAQQGPPEGLKACPRALLYLLVVCMLACHARAWLLCHTKPLPSSASLPRPARQASPQLFDLVFKGKHSAEAIVTERRGGINPVDYYKLRMEDVVVASVADVPSTTAGSPPEEEIVLRFAALTVSFTPQKPDGSLDTPICTCWNKLTATSCPCRLTG